MSLHSPHAVRWLQQYHGSIDSTALLMAFDAGLRQSAQREKWWREYATLLRQWATSSHLSSRDYEHQDRRKLRMIELRALLGVTEGTHEDAPK